MKSFRTWDDLEIVYQEWGEVQTGELPTVVLHHGFVANADANWLATGVVGALTSAGRKVIAPDARGHGNSEKPHDPDRYGEQRMARDLAVLVDTIEADEIDLVGYSMGAIVSLLFASSDERVRRLVIGGVGSGVIECGGVDRRAVSNDAIIEALSAEDTSKLEVPQALAFRQLADALGSDREALAAQAVSVYRGEIALGRITAPTLLLAGDTDPLAIRPQVLVDAIPGARLETVERESHRSAGRRALQTVHRRLPHLARPRRMSFGEIVAIAFAGLAAGTINTVVGSGTLITFPVLLAFGYAPVTANVSNTIGLVPGSISGAVGYRRELAGQRSRAIRLGTMSVLGGATGAVLLLVLPASVFKEIVPVFIAIALVLVVLQPRLKRLLAEREIGVAHERGIVVALAIYATGRLRRLFRSGAGDLVAGNSRRRAGAGSTPYKRAEERACGPDERRSGRVLHLRRTRGLGTRGHHRRHLDPRRPARRALRTASASRGAQGIDRGGGGHRDRAPAHMSGSGAGTAAGCTHVDVCRSARLITWPLSSIQWKRMSAR